MTSALQQRGAAIRAKRHACRINVIDVAIRARVTTRDVIAVEDGRGTESDIAAIELTLQEIVQHASE